MCSLVAAEEPVPVKKDKQHSRTVTAPLVRPTFDTKHLVRAAVSGLRTIFKPG